MEGVVGNSSSWDSRSWRRRISPELLDVISAGSGSFGKLLPPIAIRSIIEP